MKKIKLAVLLFGVLAASIRHGFSQTNLSFNNTTATQEGAIRLSWYSTSNEVYEIDYADSLIDTNTGTITWNTLYDDYPSHGTNTWITDAGNYDVSPEITHPKNSPMRFYRVTLVEANTSPTNPTVAISFPTNGATLSDEVTISVAASSPEILTGVKLYVDGEEQWSDDDGTNFTINTCEWPAGPHTLFATAKSQSNLEGTPNGPTITYGRAVSSYVTVNFDNLINRFDFSQPFFEPDLGQTQAVTATFATNVDWTLEIQDDSSNDVQIVTGSGANMEYDWDGTDTNGASVPNGVYSYVLSATAGGSGFDSMMSRRASLVTPFEDPTQLLAVVSDNAVVPLKLFPDGFDTNSLSVFEGRLSDYQPAMSSLAALSAESSGFTADALTPSTQKAKGPKRKPKVGNKGVAGTFGQLFKQYSTNGFQSLGPLTGLPFPLRTRVGLDGNGPAATTADGRLMGFATAATDFATYMKKAAWKSKFLKYDLTWNASTIKKTSLGGSQIFDTCNFGILMTHGSFATPGQTEADGILYTYVWLGANDTVRLSDMEFGDSSGTNGLKWMTLFGCNLLRPANITSMANNSKLPIGDNLHLLLGSATVNWISPRMGRIYATNLTAGVTIENSWYNCGTLALQGATTVTNTVTYRVMGQNNCFADTLKVNQDPDINQAFQIKSRDVFVLPP